LTCDTSSFDKTLVAECKTCEPFGDTGCGSSATVATGPVTVGIVTTDGVGVVVGADANPDRVGTKLGLEGVVDPWDCSIMESQTIS
jgi:hypothetical protein